MAHRDNPVRRSNSDATGGIADIGRRSAAAAWRANPDPMMIHIARNEP
jgi:hypothetical protein